MDTPTDEKLNIAAAQYAHANDDYGDLFTLLYNTFVAGSEWQKQQIVWSKADIKLLQLIIDGYKNIENFSEADRVFVDWLDSVKNRMQGKED